MSTHLLPKNMVLLPILLKGIEYIKVDRIKNPTCCLIQTEDIPFRDGRKIYRFPPITIPFFFKDFIFPTKRVLHIFNLKNRQEKWGYAFNLIWEGPRHPHGGSGSKDTLYYVCFGNFSSLLNAAGKGKMIPALALGFVKFFGTYNPEEHSVGVAETFRYPRWSAKKAK